MRSFSMLLKLEGKLLKNNIMSVIKSPKRIIMYGLYIVFMTWVVFTNVKNVSGSANDMGNFQSYVSGGVFAMLFMMGFGLTKKSSIYFKPSEINILFTSPIDQRKILMFTLLKRIPIYLATSIYTLIFLLSIIFSIYKPTTIELAITFFGYMMVFLILEPLGFCIFAIGTKLKSSDLNQKIVKGLFLVIGFFALFQVYQTVQSDGMSLASVASGIGSNKLNWLPIIGWGKSLTLTALNGVTPSTGLYLILMVSSYLALVFTTYILGDDYYEDVIESSAEKEVAIKKARSGKIQFNGFHLRKKKVQVKDNTSRAGAIYWKKKILTMKSDITIFFSIESILCLVLGIGAAYFVDGEAKAYSVAIASGIYFYAKFLFSMNTSLDQELKMHYYYTLPDTAINKLIAVTKVDVIRFFINISCLVVGNALILQKIEGYTLVLPFTVTMFYVMLLLSSFLLKLFFSSEDFNRLMVMFKMLQMLIVLLPALITLIVIGALTESVFLALIGSALVNIILAAVFLGLSDIIFNRLELK